MTALVPRKPVPPFEADILGGGKWRLADQKPKNFSMIVVYRGLHCPICKTYLADLDKKAEAFAQRGTEVFVVSTDSRERAEQAKRDWNLANLKLGYGLGIDAARRWGLYISNSIRESEPAQFAEPGIFLIRPDQTLYAALIQTMPMARPKFDDLMAAIDFVVAKNYPARGEA
ncbi:MAG: AhpC/TSA family protein [Rhodospirillales bacterium]|nr:AhpC/TSA family protein [Rhodospirillales bacterium]